MEFSFAAGSSVPKEQKLSVTACHNLPFSMQVAGPDWLATTPAEGILPGSASISVSPASLEPGEYRGSVVISAPDTYFGSVTVPVVLRVFAPPPPAQ